MKKKRFTEAQIAFALRFAESGTAVEQIVRKMGISEATFCRWNKEVCRVGRFGAASAQAAGRREQTAQTIGHRPDA